MSMYKTAEQTEMSITQSSKAMIAMIAVLNGVQLVRANNIPSVSLPFSGLARTARFTTIRKLFNKPKPSSSPKIQIGHPPIHNLFSHSMSSCYRQMLEEVSDASLGEIGMILVDTAITIPLALVDLLKRKSSLRIAPTPTKIVMPLIDNLNVFEALSWTT